MSGSGRSRPPEGEIVDRNGVVLATNRTVCTISVIHSQVGEPERVIEVLCFGAGDGGESEVREKVEKVSSMETDQDERGQGDRRQDPRL